MSISATQRQRVLARLKQAGIAGVHSFDLIDTISPRVAARVQELRQQGHQIMASREKRGKAWGVRYTLGIPSAFTRQVKAILIDQIPEPEPRYEPESQEVRDFRRSQLAKLKQQFLDKYERTP